MLLVHAWAASTLLAAAESAHVTVKSAPGVITAEDMTRVRAVEGPAARCVLARRWRAFQLSNTCLELLLGEARLRERLLGLCTLFERVRQPLVVLGRFDRAAQPQHCRLR